MADASTFFKESDAHLGIFYPKNYIVATLPSDGAARQAEQALKGAGIAADDVMVLSPEETRDFLLKFRDEKGVTGDMMTGLSRALGDDATFVDDDIARAERGAGFVFVHSTTPERMQIVRELVKPFGPVAMHWYLGEGIQSLV